jgi:hypothetical protein
MLYELKELDTFGQVPGFRKNKHKKKETRMPLIFGSTSALLAPTGCPAAAAVKGAAAPGADSVAPAPLVPAASEPREPLSDRIEVECCGSSDSVTLYLHASCSCAVLQSR